MQLEEERGNLRKREREGGEGVRGGEKECDGESVMERDERGRERERTKELEREGKRWRGQPVC